MDIKSYNNYIGFLITDYINKIISFDNFIDNIRILLNTNSEHEQFDEINKLTININNLIKRFRNSLITIDEFNDLLLKINTTIK